MEVWVAEERVRLPHSQAVCRRWRVWALGERSTKSHQSATTQNAINKLTLLVLSLELLNEVIDDLVVEVLASQVYVTHSRLPRP